MKKGNAHRQPPFRYSDINTKVDTQETKTMRDGASFFTAYMNFAPNMRSEFIIVLVHTFLFSPFARTD